MILLASEIRVGIVVSRQCDAGLVRIAYNALLDAGCDESNIQLKFVPNDANLALGASFFAEYTEVDGVLIVGSRCDEYTEQLFSELQVKWNMPACVFSEKSSDSIYAMIEMVQLQNEMADAAPEDHTGEHSVPRGKSVN